MMIAAAAAAAAVLLEVVASYFVLTLVVVVLLNVLVGLGVLVLVDAEQGPQNQMLAYAELQHFVLKFVVVILGFVLVDAAGEREQGLLLVVESQM